MEWTFPTTDPSPTGMLPFPDSVITPLVNEPVCTPRSGDKLLFLLDDDVTRTDGYTGWRSLGILSYTTAISTWNTFEYMNNKVARNSTLRSVSSSVTALSSAYNATEVTLMTLDIGAGMRKEELGKRDDWQSARQRLTKHVLDHDIKRGVMLRTSSCFINYRLTTIII